MQTGTTDSQALNWWWQIVVDFLCPSYSHSPLRPPLPPPHCQLQHFSTPSGTAAPSSASFPCRWHIHKIGGTAHQQLLAFCAREKEKKRKRGEKKTLKKFNCRKITKRKCKHHASYTIVKSSASNSEAQKAAEPETLQSFFFIKLNAY